MKLTNQEIINTINGLNALAEKELPITMAYEILDAIDKLMREYSVYERAHAKVKTDKELVELLDIEREVDIKPIFKQQLIDSDLKLSPVTLLNLKRLIIDG